MNPRIENDSDLVTARGLKVPVAAMQWTFTRSRGAGGQHVNKTSSRSTLVVATDAILGPTHLVERVRSALGAEITVNSQETRSQWRNRHICRQQLATVIDTAAAPPPVARKKSKPSRGSVERRLAGKKLVSAKKAGRRGQNW